MDWQTVDGRRPMPPPRRKKPPTHSAAAAAASVVDDIDDEDDDFRPVNVDMNTVKNLLHSYEAQQGAAGPTSNILAGMGKHLPPPSPPTDL